ncbi:MAG: class I SAM-dependent methyltransferase [Bacteroidia bacterium]
MSNQEHWEKIYTTKTPSEVSWTQEVPQTSLDLIAKFDLPKFAHIIDIGGGDSLLVDHLLALGYTNVTVLDISKAAIERAKKRLGEDAEKVTWLVQDITRFSPKGRYDLWHDRAVFHFLTSPEDKTYYVDKVRHASHVVLGTFSKSGPLKCSSLPITQYDEKDFTDLFSTDFEIKEYFTIDHTTPFDTIQNFSFARMTRKLN